MPSVGLWPALLVFVCLALSILFSFSFSRKLLRLMLKPSPQGIHADRFVVPKHIKRACYLPPSPQSLGRYQRLVSPGINVGLAAPDSPPASGPALLQHLPPFFLSAATGFLQIDVYASPAFPFALLGSVGSKNVFTMHRPVLANEPLSAECRLVPALRDARRGFEMDLVTDVCDERGQLVWTQCFTLTVLQRSKARSSGPRAAPRSDGSAAAAERPAATATAALHVPSNAGRAYGVLCGDLNPIHVSSILARLFGFRSAIAHGLFTAAASFAALGLTVAAYPSTVEVLMRSPVFLPSTVQCEATPPGAGETARWRVLSAGTVCIEGCVRSS